MAKFYTKWNTPPKPNTEAGTRTINTYQEQYNKDGDKELILTGKKDIYSMIQADLEGSKIENILHAVAMGDLSALQNRELMYVDTTEMPTSMMEVQNMVIKAKEQFSTLPPEVREKFNDSADMYINTMGTKDWLDKMSEYNKGIADIAAAKAEAEFNKKVADTVKFNNAVKAKEGAPDEQRS